LALTIAGVTTAETAITAAGSAQVLVNGTTYVITQDLGAAASLTTAGTATLADADFYATTLTNVAAFLTERFTEISSGNKAAFVLNDGANSYIYNFVEDATDSAVIASELTLVGIVDHVLVAGEVLQS